MQALLSFDKAPPFPAPVRFFLTAPVFGILAGVVILVWGSEVFSSRWAAATLAVTHLLTLGFMSQVMLGALIQILPVVAGANLARPLAVARLTNGGLALGTGLLAAAFLSFRPELFLSAVAVLALTLILFLVVMVWALAGIPSTSPTIRGLKLAVPGLLGTALLGSLLATGLGQGWGLPYAQLTDLHGAWGLAAWCGLLLVAVSYVVVPMFQLTPGYPARWSWWLPPVLLVLPLLWAGALAWAPALVRFGAGGLAVAGGGFVLYTLRLQRQRRRARADTTYRYWRGGLVCALVALLMLLAGAFFPELAEWEPWSLLFGVLVGVGGFVSLMVGMLYKIVPFLAWMHLNEEGQGRVLAPHMNQVLPEKAMQGQLRLHFVALGLLIGGVVAPDYLARPAGLALALAQAWLWLNVWRAFRFYRRKSAEIAAGGATAS